MDIRVKRVYEPAERPDGYRILADFSRSSRIGSTDRLEDRAP